MCLELDSTTGLPQSQKGETPQGIEENTALAPHALLAELTTGADYPLAQWRGSPNYWNSRAGNVWIAIVDHIMQSSIESADGWFHNPASEVSAHFGVARDGRVYQWVRLNCAAWANGIVNKPDTSIPWIKGMLTNGVNLNLVTVSIEHEGLSGETFTEAQYQATLALHKWLLSQNPQNIAANRNQIIGHYQIDSVSRPNCPGSAFPWQRLMADLGGTKPVQPSDPNARYFEQTGVWLNNDYGFLDYWNKNGGLSIFGLPIKPAEFDPVRGRVVQWMERARFENHPEAPPEYKVQLGLLGRELTGL